MIALRSTKRKKACCSACHAPNYDDSGGMRPMDEVSLGDKHRWVILLCSSCKRRLRDLLNAQ